MAGRGTDIVLGGNVEKQVQLLEADPDLPEHEKTARAQQLREEWQGLHEQVVALGGLRIIATERHESRRIDNQLRGRSGRQGDPGSSRFYLSLEDPLMRIFAGDRVRAIMDRLKMPEGEAIEAGIVSRSIEGAQRKVEARNFDIRKQLLEYDDVANDQRKVIYQQRNEILEADNLDDRIGNLRRSALSDVVRTHVPVESVEEQGDLPALEKVLREEWLLERPVRAMNSGLFDEGSAISRTLLDLRHTVESLDPSRQGNLFEPKKLLGLIPWGRRIEDYFQQYQSSQTHLKAILEALHNGQDELRRDNAAIEEEKAQAWQVMERLEQYVVFGRRVDAALVARLAAIDAADPEKGRVVREELLFYVRQKVQDLLTQLAVTIQGYLAMDMIRRNNLELIKGVDRASTSTISALRTAVIVAQALANQKLVLDQIGALNQTTGNLLVSTSAMLKSQAGQIHEQATSSAIGLDTLRESFRNVYDTIEMVSTYKLKALDTMQQTIESLDQEVRQSRRWLDRVRDQAVTEVRDQLEAPAPVPQSGR
jgi:uncharacterized protein YaaN involved in tellurite resistance